MEALNIEEALINWLGAKLSCPIVADVPENRPSEFVSIERVGGREEDIVVDYPSVAVQCWSTTRLKASNLAYRVDFLLRNEFIYEEQRVSTVERSGLYNFPDLKGKKPRYQIVVDFTTA